MCLKFSSASVCRMFSWSLTGKVSHVPSVVLSMLKTRPAAAAASPHAASLSVCVDVYSPGRNRSAATHSFRTSRYDHIRKL